MRQLSIAFIHPGQLAYTPDTPYHAPLGGTESAVAYLAAALAANGHQVMLAGPGGTGAHVRGVLTITTAQAVQHLPNVDAAVIVNSGDISHHRPIRSLLPAAAPLVLWTHHPADQPAIAGLADRQLAAIPDAIAFVSNWQRDGYLERFPLSLARCRVMPNAIGPAFVHEDNRTSPRALRSTKADPPILIYATAPYRGLGRMLMAFQIIRAARPDVVLEVYSSLAPYQVAPENDDFAPLYQLCKTTPGVIYKGAVSQPLLAKAMARAALFVYPNIVPESFCITALEAMAAGCLVVTSQLGALPDTTSGFARLTPVPDDGPDHARLFATATLEALAEWQAWTPALEERLTSQAAEALAANWDVRAKAWTAWLTALISQRQAS